MPLVVESGVEAPAVTPTLFTPINQLGEISFLELTQ